VVKLYVAKGTLVPATEIHAARRTFIPSRVKHVAKRLRRARGAGGEEEEEEGEESEAGTSTAGLEEVSLTGGPPPLSAGEHSSSVASDGGDPSIRGLASLLTGPSSTLYSALAASHAHVIAMLEAALAQPGVTPDVRSRLQHQLASARRALDETNGLERLGSPGGASSGASSPVGLPDAQSFPAQAAHHTMPSRVSSESYSGRHASSSRGVSSSDPPRAYVQKRANSDGIVSIYHSPTILESPSGEAMDTGAGTSTSRLPLGDASEGSAHSMRKPSSVVRGHSDSRMLSGRGRKESLIASMRRLFLGSGAQRSP